MEVKPGHQRPETFEQMVARFVKGTLSEKADEGGFDSFEDADDFTEEDPETLPLTHHEVIAMTTEELQDYAPEGAVLLEEAPQEAPQAPMDTTVSAEGPPAPAQVTNSEDPQEQSAPVSGAGPISEAV